MPDVVHVQVSYDPDVDVWLPKDRDDPSAIALQFIEPVDVSPASTRMLSPLGKTISCESACPTLKT